MPTFGQPVAIAATAAPPYNGVPTGWADFYDGNNLLGSAALSTSGIATYVVSGLALGSHTIKANYRGDLNFIGSGQSQTVQITQVSDGTFSSDETTVTAAGITFRRPLVVPWSFTATGTTYYIDVNGSDSNSGNQGSPFATIQKFFNIANAGDIGYMKPGTYVQHAQLNRSGTTGVPIILSCAPGALGQVTVQPELSWCQSHAPSTGYAPIELHACHDVTVNGLICQGILPNTAASGQCGIVLTNALTNCNITVQNCICFGNLHCGLKEPQGNATGYTVKGCVFHGNGVNTLDHGVYAPSGPCTYDGNISFNNTGYGLHFFHDLTGPVGVVAARNICASNGVGGIALYSLQSSYYNNVVWNNNGRGIQLGQPATLTGANNVLTNNIVANNQNAEVSGGGDSTTAGNASSYNDFYPIGLAANWFSSGNTSVNDINIDPLFLNAVAGDFRLQVGSPCIGTGTDVGYGTNRGAF